MALTPRAAALVVHDLKNELGALEGGLAQLVLAPGVEAAAAAHRQCRVLRQRLVMFLTLYGVDGDLQALSEDESPQELLEAIAARHIGPATGPAPVVACPLVAPAYWHFDRRLVGLALEAAVHNALQHARQRVALGARAEPGHLVFNVDDDGPGLGPCVSSRPDSTGLGTELCRAVARAHGVRRRDSGVRLFNRTEGGARFELWLPT